MRQIIPWIFTESRRHSFKGQRNEAGDNWLAEQVVKYPNDQRFNRDESCVKPRRDLKESRAAGNSSMGSREADVIANEEQMKKQFRRKAC